MNAIHIVVFSLSLNLVVGLVLAPPVAAQDLRVAPVELEYARDHFLVRFDVRTSARAIAGLHARFGTRPIYQSPAGFDLVAVPKGRAVEKLVEAFARAPGVAHAQLDYKLYALATPDDPYFGYQWHMDKIRMTEAWDLETGKPSVVVAVLDTGVNRGGQDLAGTSFVAGYDFAYGDSDPTDGEGHGTHVTGTIAQTTGNGLGVAGVAYNVSIMPVKVLDDSGSGYMSSIADGLHYAADHGAHVINMSLGTSARSGDPGPVLHDAVIYAYNSGVTLVAAAGNDGSRNSLSYPAAYAEVIAVGATRYDDSVTRYSNKGSQMELAAPGGDTGVDQNGDGYGDGVLQETFDANGAWGYFFYQGTSMACPHVAGAAGLLIAAGVQGPANVRQVLRDSAVDLGEAGWDSSYGYGRIDVRAALELAGGGIAPVCSADADCDDANACTLDTCLNPGTDSASCHNTSAADDTSCGASLICCGGVCGAPACWADTDCADAESCTADICLEAGTCSASCQSTWPVCGAGDGCCGPACTAETDPDCPADPFCGDGTCDSAEDCASCEADCGACPAAVCGDGVCSGYWNGEDCNTCPADCPRASNPTKKSCCGDGVCGWREDASICPVDCQ